MITAEDRKKYQYYTDGAILGIKLIGGLDDQVLFKLTERDEKILSAVITLMGEKTNSNWVVARAAEELYDRELIDERKLDQITDY